MNCLAGVLSLRDRSDTIRRLAVPTNRPIDRCQRAFQSVLSPNFWISGRQSGAGLLGRVALRHRFQNVLMALRLAAQRVYASAAEGVNTGLVNRRCAASFLIAALGVIWHFSAYSSMESPLNSQCRQQYHTPPRLSAYTRRELNWQKGQCVTVGSVVLTGTPTAFRISVCNKYVFM